MEKFEKDAYIFMTWKEFTDEELEKIYNHPNIPTIKLSREQYILDKNLNARPCSNLRNHLNQLDIPFDCIFDTNNTEELKSIIEKIKDKEFELSFFPYGTMLLYPNKINAKLKFQLIPINIKLSYFDNSIESILGE